MLSGGIRGIDKVIKNIQKIDRELLPKMQVFMRRLADEGYKVASSRFEKAIYSGHLDVEVLEPEWRDENTLVLAAEGQSVAFVEFGTGKSAPYPMEPLPDGIVRHGEYGDKKGADPPWTYVGDPGVGGAIIHTKKDGRTVVRTWGNPPARAMFDAGQEMRNRIAEIAREVFSK